MFRQLNNKIRYYFVITTVLLVSLMSWSFAIKRTVLLVSENRTIAQRVNSGNKELSRLEHYESELATFSSGVSTEEASCLESFIMEEVGELCADYRVRIVDFPNQVVYNEAKISVETHTLELMGDFKSLLLLLEYVEGQLPMGKVVSVKFQKVKDRKSKSFKLYLTIYIQVLKMQDEEYL